MATPPTNTAIDRILSKKPAVTGELINPKDRSNQTNAQINAKLLEALILANGGAIHSEAGENHSPRAVYDEGMIDTSRGPVPAIQWISFELGDGGKIKSDSMATKLAAEIPALMPSLKVEIDYEAREDKRQWDDQRDVDRSGTYGEQSPHGLRVEIKGADIASPELTGKLMEALGQAMGVGKPGFVR